MNSETMKQMKKYLKPGNGWRIGAIVCVVLALIYMVPLPVLLPVCLLIAALCIWRYRVAGRKLVDSMNEGTGEMERVLQDFTSAKPAFNDWLRMGNSYLFGKNHGKFVRYEDIRQVYQHIQRTNFVETSRNLMYVGPDGKARALCRLPLRDRGKEELMKVIAMILVKNPGVKIGYK